MGQFSLCGNMALKKIHKMYDKTYYRFLVNAGGTRSRRLRFL
jgi:hypothetical protein